MATLAGFKLIYNPYEQKLFLRGKDGSELNKSYWPLQTELNAISGDQGCVLPNIAEEILKTISNYLGDSDIECPLSFVGIKEDYEDFLAAIVVFNEDKENPHVEFKCEKDNGRFYEPDEIRELCNKYAEELAVFQNKHKDVIGEAVTEDPRKKLIEGLKCLQNKKSVQSIQDDVENPEIPIVVVGTYSSGKSALINALIGEEILPVNLQTETKYCCKVKRGEKGCYTLSYRKDESIQNLSFDNAYEMYNCIAGFDAEEAKQQIEQGNSMIEVTVPYTDSSIPDNLNIVFYDTPGNDSAKDETAATVIKNALEEAGRGFILYTVKPDAIQSNENHQKMIDFRELYSQKLDINNSIVVVNQCDKNDPISISTVIKKDESVAASKQNRIIPVSSAVGLKFKGYDDIHDPDIKKAVKHIVSDYSPDDSNFASVCKLPARRKHSVTEALKKVQEVYDPDIEDIEKEYAENPNFKELMNELLLHAYGIRALEAEITFVAKRFFPYNQVHRIQRRLQENIKKTDEQLENRIKEKKGLIEKCKEDFHRRHKTLISEVDDKCIISKTNFSKELPKKIQKEIKETKCTADGLNKEFIKIWKSSRDSNVAKIIQKKCDEIYGEEMEKLYEVANDYRKEQLDSLIDSIKEIINSNQNLSQEQKNLIIGNNKDIIYEGEKLKILPNITNEKSEEIHGFWNNVKAVFKRGDGYRQQQENMETNRKSKEEIKLFSEKIEEMFFGEFQEEFYKKFNEQINVIFEKVKSNVSENEKVYLLDKDLQKYTKRIQEIENEIDNIAKIRDNLKEIDKKAEDLLLEIKEEK